jgi:hypothetical protein
MKAHHKGTKATKVDVAPQAHSTQSVAETIDGFAGHGVLVSFVSLWCASSFRPLRGSLRISTG